MYCLVIVKCLIHYLYLFYDAYNSESIKNVGVNSEAKDGPETGAASRFQYMLVMTMPLKHLIWDSNQRKVLSRNGNVFPTSSKSWLWKSMPNNLGTVLVLLTFGVLAPALALIVTTALFAETYIVELIMGRFLVREISVIIYSRKKLLKTYQKEQVQINDDLVIKSQAEDVNESWGAVAALKEVEKLCKKVPVSIFSTSREIILLFLVSVLSFLLNDVVNSSGDPYVSISWPSIVMMTAPIVSIFAVKLYNHKNNLKQEESKEQPDDVELTDVIPTTPEETHNPVHI